MNLLTDIESIKGVGPRSAAQLRAAGITNVGELITFLPRKYDDFSSVQSIVDLQPGKATIKARVESITTRRVRRAMSVTTATLVDKTSKVQAVWFNQAYRQTQFKSGQEYYFSGQFELKNGRYQLMSPSAEQASEITASTNRLLPIYHQIRGLKSQLVRKILLELRPLISVLPETLPDSVITDQHLIGYAKALEQLHFPENQEQIAAARERLGFEELFQLILASRLNRDANQKLRGYAMKFDPAVVRDFVKRLPFSLTDAQRIAAWDIIQDFTRDIPMNRMLQGDVGAGKTVVAGIAALVAVKNNLQVALMAPTEILARQHAATLDALLAPFGLKVGLLIGAIKGKAREELLRHIASGEVDIVVGTQAIIQDSVVFKELGFVVIDEQHRFGVEQRQKLQGKSLLMPHVLTMTATPIPRSLQLTLFGELDISILNQLPASRKPIKTGLVAPASAPKIYEKIDQEITAGRQAYIICGLIEDSALNDKKSVETEYQRLRRTIFAHRAIGLLHGRMKAAEKEQVMNDFKAGKYDILLSTTVVEVGIDVPNATIIMIENADTFGLAQLHQLRGRVGRSDLQSYCYLMLSDSKKPTERLRAIEKSNDGFYLADVDLKLRGPGEIYGRAQHGDLNLQIASLADTKLIKRASDAAARFVESGAELVQYKQLAAAVAKYQRLTTLN